MPYFNESVLEEAILECLASIGWQVLFGLEIISDEPALKNALLLRLMNGKVRGKITEKE
jgi:hypothetical protein